MRRQVGTGYGCHDLGVHPSVSPQQSIGQLQIPTVNFPSVNIPKHSFMCLIWWKSSLALTVCGLVTPKVTPLYSTGKESCKLVTFSWVGWGDNWNLTHFSGGGKLLPSLSTYIQTCRGPCESADVATQVLRGRGIWGMADAVKSVTRTWTGKRTCNVAFPPRMRFGSRMKYERHFVHSLRNKWEKKLSTSSQSRDSPARVWVWVNLRPAIPHSRSSKDA